MLKLMVVLQQLGEVTVMVVDKVSVKELVKPLAPDLVEEKEVTMEEVMDLIETYVGTTENFSMVLVAWEVPKQDLNRRSLEEVILEVAEMEEEFQKVAEKVLDHQEVLDLAQTKDLVKVWEMPSWVVMVTQRSLVALEVVMVTQRSLV